VANNMLISVVEKLLSDISSARCAENDPDEKVLGVVLGAEKTLRSALVQAKAEPKYERNSDPREVSVSRAELGRVGGILYGNSYAAWQAAHAIDDLERCEAALVVAQARIAEAEQALVECREERRLIVENGDSNLLRVTSERDEAIKRADLRRFRDIAADRLADEVSVLVRRNVISARCPAADALLDYRDPPFTERADRLAEVEEHLAAVLKTQGK
jgi:hypothetical protein